ncbi:MAG: TonB-dependent receptor [Cyclobacteriaceae bacterium]
MLTSHHVHAQQDRLSQQISVAFDNLAFEEVIHVLETETGLSFSFNPNRIDLSQKVTYQATDKKVNEIFRDISSLVDVSFEVLEGAVILKPRKGSPENKKELVTLSGYIFDEANGEALIGATVLLSPQLGVVTNAYGFYSITVEPGEYEISFSYLGFERKSMRLNLAQSDTYSVKLNSQSPLLEEIVVTASNTEDVAHVVSEGRTQLKPETVSEKPALFGEADAVKSLEMIPGIKLHSDGSTFYYVRGGDRDQNLIMIDDAPVYNPNHLLGLFSTIIPEAVNDIQLYKGNMPAWLGGRLSSMMDVRTKKGNDQNFEASGGVGLLTTRLTVEGPFSKDKSSFLLSGRFSRVKWFFKALEDNITKFHFYDLTGKLNFNLNEKNKIYFSFYNGGDEYFAINNGVNWSNNAASFRWNHVINKRVFLNTTLAGGVYDYYLHTNFQNNAKWHSHLSNITLKTDFSYFHSPTQKIDFGLALTGYNFNPGNFSTTAFRTPAVSVRNSSELVLYGNHEVELGKRWLLNYGLRLSTWTNEGGSFEFVFDENRIPVDTLFFQKGDKYQQYARAEPRLSLTYKLNENDALKAGVSRNVQNIHLISNSISPFTSFEVWLPSSVNIQPQSALQFELGYHKAILEKGLSVEIGSFFKRMKNQIDYEAHAETLLNPLFERELRFGKGIAYGAEFSLRKNTGKLQGLLGYTYSRAKRTFDEINGGRTFNAFYDRPHQVNVVANYDVNQRWTLGLNWTYYTGAPYSSPISFYLHNGLEVPLYDQKNNSRLPDYHRLDLSATLQLNKNPESRFQHDLTFSVYNAYARKNALFINYNKTETVDGTFKVPFNQLDGQRVTTQFYLFQFTPSFTYNFRWR